MTIMNSVKSTLQELIDYFDTKDNPVTAKELRALTREERVELVDLIKEENRS